MQIENQQQKIFKYKLLSEKCQYPNKVYNQFYTGFINPNYDATKLKKIKFISQSQLQQNVESLKKRKINYESVVSVIIQTIYLLTISHMNKIKLKVFQFKFDKRQLKLQSSHEFNLFLKYQIDDRNQQYQKKVKQTTDQISLFFKNLQSICSLFANTNNFKKIWQRLTTIKTKLYNHISKWKDELAFINILQQTQIFRKNSILNQIYSNSILGLFIAQDLFFIEKNQQNKQNYSSLKQKLKNQTKDTSLRAFRYHKLLEQEFLLNNKQQYKKNVISNIKQFFNTKNFSQIVDVSSEDTSKQKKYIFWLVYLQKLKKNSDDNPQSRQYSFIDEVKKIIKQKKLKESLISQFQALSEKQKQKNNPLCINQFSIQIQFDDVDLITVRYFTEHELNVQNSDSFMYNCNNFSFGLENVNIEIYEKPSKKDQAGKRYMTFKGTSKFEIGEPILEKILITMDVLIIAFKCIQPQLTKIIIVNEDYVRVEEVMRKFYHYRKLWDYYTKQIYSVDITQK